MIIDAHVHLKHGDANKTEYTAEEIVKTMDAVGIQKSIVFAMSTTTQRSLEMAQAAVNQFPDRLIPYVYALPNYERPVLKEIDKAVSELGFPGIKIHVGECTLAEYVVDPVIKLAGKRSVPCLIDFGGRLNELERMAKKFPQTKLIVAHLGRYLCQDEALIDRCIALAEVYANVFLDVSGVVILNKIKEAIQQVGSSRVIWGTDGPHKKPDTIGFAQDELDKILNLNLSPADEAAIMGETITSLLKM